MRKAPFGVKCVLVLMVAVTLPAFAGIRGPRQTVKELTINGASVGEGRWEVSSPTLACVSGFLAYDASGKLLKVTFEPVKGPGTTWSFVERTTFEEFKNKGREDGWYLSEIQRGYEMKLQAAEGPFKGWYLGRGEGKSWVLVKDRRNAATVRMLESIQESRGK